MLSKELKKSAAEAFQLADLDATDSTTASESEGERLKRYSGPPSPRSSSRRFRERIAELGPKLPIRELLGNKLLDRREDDRRRMNMNYWKTRGSRGNVWSTDMAALASAEGREEFGTSAVVMDLDPESNEFDIENLKGVNEYKAWQVRRQAQDSDNNRPSVLEQDSTTRLSHLGLFALLPGELRNRIYRYSILTESSEPFLIAMQPGTCSLGPCTHSKLPSAVPGLLSACRQIRHEAIPIFCAENTFKFDQKTVRERCVGNWLRCLGAYGRLITAIVLEIMVWEPVWPNSSEKVGRPYVMKFEFVKEDGVESSVTLPNLVIDSEICLREKEICGQLFEHVEHLRQRAMRQDARLEVFLHEFVSSDWMAELVYRCKK